MSKDSISEKLQELFELYKSNAITKEEFEALKSEMIGFSNEQQKKVVEEQPPIQSDTSKTNVIEEEPQELKTVAAHDKPNKIEEDSPVEISKPAVESKKKKPIMVFILIGVIAITGLAIGLYSFLGLGSNQTLESNVDDELSFDYEVYDTSNDRNAPYLNVRSTPHSESAIDFRLNDGDKVAVLESGIGENNMWLKIKVQNNPSLGYVHGRYIRKIGSLIGSSDVEAAQSAEIETFLKIFFFDYINMGSNTKHAVHPNIGIQILKNPGAICYGTNSQEIEQIDLQIVSLEIFNHIPLGGICDGFPNASDGFYYRKISNEELPIFGHYVQETDDIITKRVTIPSGYGSVGDIQKVFVIKEKYLSGAFYFARISGKWYLICESFCDCSA